MNTPLSVSGRILAHLDLDRETAPGLWIALAGSLTIGAVIHVSYGNVFAGAAVVLLIGLMLVTFYRVVYSFFAFIGMVLLFDQFQIPGFHSLTYKFDYFKNLKEITFLPSIPAGVLNAIELHLLFILFVWVLILVLRRDVRLSRIPVWGAFLLLYGWFIFSIIYGIKTGGDFLPALWETRALFYLAFVYLMIPHLIQTRKQLEMFMWICIGIIAFKAFQGVGRYAILGFNFRGLPALTNHEDPLFILSLCILLLGFLVFKVDHKQRKSLLFLLLPLLLGFYTGQRRAVIAASFVVLPVFFILLPGDKQRKFLKGALPVVIFFVVYCGTFWNSNHVLAQPVQLIKSGIVQDKESMSLEDYYSNLYREYENYDLAVTARTYPIFGTGFGKKYLQPIPLVNIAFPLRDYIPHNEIFWIIVKTGSIGFFFFWLFFTSYGLHGATVFMTLRDPYLKSICGMIIATIIAQMVVSYYDLQLTFYRNMIYLGALMGLLPVLQRLDEPPPKNRAEKK